MKDATHGLLNATPDMVAQQVTAQNRGAVDGRCRCVIVTLLGATRHAPLPLCTSPPRHALLKHTASW